MKIYSREEAVKLIKSDDLIVTSGFMLCTVAEEILETLEKRFNETKEPKNLTVMCGAGVGDLGKDLDFGLNHFAHEGMLKRVVVGHFGSNNRIVDLVNQNKVEAYNWPQGVVGHVVRATANGQKGYLTKIGLRTFIDPRLEGSKLNDITEEDLVQLVNLDGEDYLYYKAPKVDIALIRGTTADEVGNITFEEEAAYSMAKYAAMAAKASGGKVIVQVKNVVKAGQLDAQQVQIAGIFVDAIVITENIERNHRQTPGVYYNPALAGHVKVPVDLVKPLKLSDRKIIGRRAAMELVPHSIVNLGIGIPEAVSDVATEEGCSDDLVMTVEAGAIGGSPAGGTSFGTSLNAWSMNDEPTQFDFYHSGALDMTFLGLAEVNKNGDVNVSKFGPQITGCGGFIDISQSTKKVVYCGTFTAGGLKVEIRDGKLNILTEGRIMKFKKDVQQVTFSAEQALENGQTILYITERAVFQLTTSGLELIEIAPGINLERDVLAQMEFTPIVSKNLKVMDNSLFQEERFGLKDMILQKEEKILSPIS